ncbi:MAG: hypothetical protein AABX96_04025 [Nanoarchaeota archaeon]
MVDAPNYSVNSRILGNCAYDGGLCEKVFVDKNSGDRPYVVIGPLYNDLGVVRFNGEYVGADGVYPYGTSHSFRLNDHLNDPEYDEGVVTSETSKIYVADFERVRQIRLRGVGD